jgi:hypothetical protein
MKKKKQFKEVAVGGDAVLEFTRARWKHYLRWLVFSVAILLWLMLMLSSYSTHFIRHIGFVPQEFVVYVLSTFMLLPVMPQVFFEVDHIRLDQDGFQIQNLMMKKHEKWENVVQFADPRYLKFAMLRTKSFIYFLNRRDLPEFDKLVERIKEKTIKQLK